MEIRRYRAGDDVPTHILDVEPEGPSGPRPRITFVGDVDVIDTDERFILMLVNGTAAGVVMVQAAHGDSCKVFAPTKPVAIPVQWSTIGFDDGDDWGSPEKPIPAFPLIGA